MTAEQRLERDLPDVLAQLGASHTPDYRDDVVERIAGVRQRPAWTIPERWLRMDVATAPVVGPRAPTWRTLAVAVLIILALVLTVVAVGATRPHLPAPYGPAANGLMAWSEDGDIYLGDPASGDSRVLIAGPDTDVDPWFSFDGTRIMFLRQSYGDLEDLVVADLDGTDVRVLTSTPIVARQGWEWSGDGRSIVLTSRVDGMEEMSIVDVETSAIRTLDLGLDVRDAFYAPPTGDAIAFVSPSLLDVARLFVVGADGTDLRAVTERTTNLSAPTFSPDGRWIAYSGRDEPTGPILVHIVGIGGGDARVIPNPPDVVAQFDPQWSPDGQSLLIRRTHARPLGGSTPVDRVAIIPTEGSSSGREIATSADFGTWTWSPDGRQVMFQRMDGYQQVTVVDAATGASSPLPLSSGAQYPSWQRVQP